MLAACNKKNEEVSTTTPAAAEATNSNASDTLTQTPEEQLYSCPMHPEVTGKKGDKCPKCEMDLTETVD